jgi:hypothetical protein
LATLIAASGEELTLRHPWGIDVNVACIVISSDGSERKKSPIVSSQERVI